MSGAGARLPSAFAAVLAAALALVPAALLAGCGGVRAADLFVVTRTGSAAQNRLTLLVNEEGGVRCNGAHVVRMRDPLLVQARAIQEESHDAASRNMSLPARPGSVYSYLLRDEHGTVRFSDNSAAQPPVLRHLQLFVLQVAQDVCHLPQ